MVMKKKIVAVTLGLVLFLTGCTIGTSYNPPKEIPPTERYEIISVDRAMKTYTTSFGAATNWQFIYYFVYKDINGNLYQMEMAPRDDGLYRLCTGETDEYIIEYTEKPSHTYHYLVLTEETLKEL